MNWRSAVNYARRLFWLNRVQPITIDDVVPDRLSVEKEATARAADTALATQLLSLERTSGQLRMELAHSAINIVSGRRSAR